MALRMFGLWATVNTISACLCEREGTRDLCACVSRAETRVGMGCSADDVRRRCGRGCPRAFTGDPCLTPEHPHLHRHAADRDLLADRTVLEEVGFPSPLAPKVAIENAFSRCKGKARTAVY